ncbi:MAG TPA: hypothetical protein VKU19_14900 [Bryobacteraceae bacterium]|nr:hypothetical protein [Bryobacteraceae bacterium]
MSNSEMPPAFFIDPIRHQQVRIIEMNPKKPEPPPPQGLRNNVYAGKTVVEETIVDCVPDHEERYVVARGWVIIENPRGLRVGAKLSIVPTVNDFPTTSRTVRIVSTTPGLTHTITTLSRAIGGQYDMIELTGRSAIELYSSEGGFIVLSQSPEGVRLSCDANRSNPFYPAAEVLR